MKKIVLIIVLLISLIVNVKVFFLDKYMYVGEKEKWEEVVIVMMWYL